MVPSAIVALDELPRDGNGKVDRDALRALAPQPERADVIVESVAGAVVKLWEAHLHASDLTTSSNYFECGGHSLAAAAIAADIQQVFGVQLPLKTLYRAATPLELARAILALRSPEKSEQPGPTIASRHQPPSSAQKRVWFMQQLAPGTCAYNSCATVTFRGDLKIDCLERALNELVRRHESLRTTFECISGEPVRRVHGFKRFSIPRISVEKEQGPELKLRESVEVLVRTPFNLTVLPLCVGL